MGLVQERRFFVSCDGMCGRYIPETLTETQSFVTGAEAVSTALAEGWRVIGTGRYADLLCPACLAEATGRELVAAAVERERGDVG